MSETLSKTTSFIGDPKKVMALGLFIIILAVLYFVFKNQIASLFRSFKNTADANTLLADCRICFCIIFAA